MNDTSMICAGIDVAKGKLDIALHPTGKHLQVTYDAAGLKRLDAFLVKHGVGRVGFEASGGYEWRLLVHLRASPVPAGRFQPAQVRYFAKSRLKLAKNDKLDAALIAAFTANLDALPALPDARFDTLNAELTYLEQIEDQVSVLKTMAETTRAPSLKRLHEQDIARLQKRREARMLLIAALVAKDDELARRRALLVSIKGIGLRTALALVIRLPELGSLSRGEIAALTGLAPPMTTTAAKGADGAMSEAVAPGCARACSWAPSPHRDAIPISRPSTGACARTANIISSPPSPSPASSSSWPMPSLHAAHLGPLPMPEHKHGCSP